MTEYLYNPDMPLVTQFDFLRENIRPEAYTDTAIAAAMERLYDAIVPVMQGYRDLLGPDDPLAVYLNYFTRTAIDILEDENDEPELYATVPLGSIIEGKFTKIPALSTVRITAASPLGDVGITRNLSASRGFETRVFWDSLTDYRVTAEKEVENGNTSA
jgi:hypothetical protein